MGRHTTYTHRRHCPDSRGCDDICRAPPLKLGITFPTRTPYVEYDEVEVKRLLTPDTQDILQQRVYLARSTHLFTLSDLARGFKMDSATIFRYTDPRYRTLSLQYARARTERIGRVGDSCQSCGDKLEEHLRCRACTILLHREEDTCGAAYCIASRLCA